MNNNTNSHKQLEIKTKTLKFTYSSSLQIDIENHNEKVCRLKLTWRDYYILITPPSNCFRDANIKWK